MGLQVAGLFFRFSSYSFGSGRSCLSFQNHTSVVVALARALAKGNGLANIFNGIDGICVNYIDDLILLGRNAICCQKMFRYVREAMLFLNFKLSIKKQLEPTTCGVLLGLEFDMCAQEVRCSSERAEDIVKSIEAFRQDPSAQSNEDLTHWVGQCGFLAYHATYASAYMTALYAIQWVPLEKRRGLVDGRHPLCHHVLQALTWWCGLLCGSRVLWSVAHDPVRWAVTHSDASDRSFGVFDMQGRAVIGDFKKSRGQIIMFKELRAITEYFKHFKVPKRTGFLHLCDNLNVVQTINRGYAKSSAAFRDEYIAFHKFCESRALTCRSHYVNTHDNFVSDSASRSEPWLALHCLARLGQPVTCLRTDLRNALLISTRGVCSEPCSEPPPGRPTARRSVDAPPPGHPKPKLSVITWESPDLTQRRSVPAKYYSDLVKFLKRIPDGTLSSIVGSSPSLVYIRNRWGEFIDCIQVYYQMKVRASNFEYLLGEWIRRKHFESPGRKGNVHCGPATLHLWAVACCKAFHAVTRPKDAWVGWEVHAPKWMDTQYDILKSVPLYRPGEPKYWMGELPLLRAWKSVFSVEDCVRISNDFANARLTPEQQCVLIDKFLYETLNREGEVLRHVIPGQAEHNRTHIELYHSNFCDKIGRDLLSHGSRLEKEARALAGVVGFNDRQKNQARSVKTTHNKWYLALDDATPEAWAGTSARFMTNRWMLSVLFGYDIPRDATEINVVDKWRPLFPPLSDPQSWYNVTKAEIDAVRRRVYSQIVPPDVLRLVSGHCWRGGQAGFQF